MGKTHLAIALGHEVILAGDAVQFVTATTLMASLAMSHSESRLEDRLLSLAKPKLLAPRMSWKNRCAARAGSEKGAMLITSDRNSSEWGTVFGDTVTTPVLDRFPHHSHVTDRGDSVSASRQTQRASAAAAP